MARYFGLDSTRTVIEILPIEISSDARSAPIEAFSYETFGEEDLMSENFDTMEVCFPVRDSFKLPSVIVDKLNTWMKEQVTKQASIVHVTGTANGTGITESSDVAFERAEVVKDQFLKIGWSEENIQVSTGQRSLPQAIRNQCVLIYFE